MSVVHLLPLLVVLPILGGLACAVIGRRGSGGGLVRGIAVCTALAHLVAALFVAGIFNWDRPGTQLDGVLATFTTLNFSIHFGTDALSLLLTLVTSVLAVTALLASAAAAPDDSDRGGAGGAVRGREGAYYGWLCVLLAAMTGVWLARDLLLFYCFFELILVPLFFLIGTFGGPERRAAATKIFIYTFAGSVLALPAMLYVGLRAGTFDLAQAIEFAQQNFTPTQRAWVLTGLLISFGVKTPLFPLHTWQPSAMAEAPGNGVVDALGLVLKLGAYALLTIAVPIGLIDRTGPSAVVAFPGVLTLLATLAVIGIIYGALCAWVQTDIKRLLAYSSLSHVGFIVLGIVALSPIGLVGASMYLLSTALITGALFLTVGMIYARYGTRDTAELSGLGKPLPILSFFLGLFTMAAIGLPLTSGFVSEFLSIMGAFTSSYLPMTFGILAALGIVLGAVYMLSMAARVLFGPVKTPTTAAPVRDLGFREIFVLSSLAVLILAMGVLPRPVLKALEGTSSGILEALAADGQLQRTARHTAFPAERSVSGLRGDGVRGDGVTREGVRGDGAPNGMLDVMRGDIHHAR